MKLDPSKIKFYKEDHEYWAQHVTEDDTYLIDQRLVQFDEEFGWSFPLPSVTRLVNFAMHIQYDRDNQIVQNAARAGTAFHKHIEQSLISPYAPNRKETVGSSWEKYEAWKKWWEAEADTGMHWPEAVVVGMIGKVPLAGTVDLVCFERREERGVLYEWKSAKRPSAKTILSWKLQTRLYLYLLKQMRSDYPNDWKIVIWSPNKIIRFDAQADNLFLPAEFKSLSRHARNMVTLYKKYGYWL